MNTKANKAVKVARGVAVACVVALALGGANAALAGADKSKSVDDCRDNFQRAEAAGTCKIRGVRMKYGKYNWCRIKASCQYQDDTGNAQRQRTYISARLDRLWTLTNCDGELGYNC